MEGHRVFRVRNAVILCLVMCAVFLFRGSPSNRSSVYSDTEEHYVIAERPSYREELQGSHGRSQGMEEGNFTLWARQRFTSDALVSAISTNTMKAVITGKMLGDDRVLHSAAEKEVQQSNTQSRGNPLRGSPWLSQREEEADDEESSESEERLMGGHYAANATPAKELMNNVPLSSIFPHGGNALPNYLIHGIDQGLKPSDYRNGVVTFLHHNKAAGSSIKECLSSMVKRGIMKNHSLLIVSSKVISKRSSVITKYSAFAGGYTFWICEQFQGRPCSYFTIMRNPYDRILSSYFYCQVQYWDQLCGPLMAGNFTIKQWAIYQGSYFFNQMLMNPTYCQENNVIRDIFENDISDIVPPNTSKYITYQYTHQCWFKQKVYLSKVLNITGKDILFQHVLANLDSWFSVVGLTEEFDISLKMLSVTYDLPFFRRCRGKIINKNPSKNEDAIALREKLKESLQSDPEVTEALSYDLKIYEMGRNIFKRQKERMDYLGNLAQKDIIANN